MTSEVILVMQLQSKALSWRRNRSRLDQEKKIACNFFPLTLSARDCLLARLFAPIESAD
jgi:hypothetical protein